MDNALAQQDASAGDGAGGVNRKTAGWTTPTAWEHPAVLIQADDTGR
jgi:hypothetical protein